MVRLPSLIDFDISAFCRIMGLHRQGGPTMLLPIFLGIIAISAVSLAATTYIYQHSQQATAAAPQWGYSGDEDPAHWGSLSPDFILCEKGDAQSPIDICDATDVALAEVAFSYRPTPAHIVNNGRSIQIDVAAGNYISYDGVAYQLAQFHFHHPSEHTINGQAAEMEVHFVHQNPQSGEIAVVGILMQINEGDNAAYARIFENMPAKENQRQSLGMVDLAALVPTAHTYYAYGGSLTTPPCSESVHWIVLDTAVDLSAAQVAAFAALYAMNARPIQPRGARSVLHTA